MPQHYSVNAGSNTCFVHSEGVEDHHLQSAFRHIGGSLAPAAVGHAVAGPKKQYVYRKMAEAEFTKTLEKGGILYPEARNPRSAERVARVGEKWFTESLQHTRGFNNQGASGSQVVAEFEVHKPGYKNIKTHHTIPQAGSRGRQPARGRPFNVTNTERLGNHPKEKVNIGLKGRQNIDMFNEHVISVQKINPDSVMNKTSALRWLRRSKLTAFAGAVGVIVDAGSLILSVIEDGGKFGPSTKVTLAGIGGSALGGSIGAAIGSILPGIGTFIGGFIGGLIGSLVGNGIMNFFLGYSPAVPGPGLPAAEWDNPFQAYPEPEWESGGYDLNPPLQSEWDSIGPDKMEFPQAEWDNIPGTGFTQPEWDIQ